MSELEATPIQLLLEGVEPSEAERVSRLFEDCADDLRRIARGLLRKERAHHTLQPTALVNEAYLRLFDGTVPSWPDAASFFTSVAREMRRVLTDYARRRLAAKRGGKVAILPLEAVREPVVWRDPAVFLALSVGIERLHAARPRAAAIIELSFFAGLSNDEIAALYGITPRTIQRDLEWAHAQLGNEMWRTP